MSVLVEGSHLLPFGIVMMVLSVIAFPHNWSWDTFNSTEGADGAKADAANASNKTFVSLAAQYSST
jgi:hypothetical protein